jgi:RNase P subunit RPR2
MKPKFSKAESKEKINKFFLNIEDKDPDEVKKIKRLAMNQKISIKEHRKKFCKNCLIPFNGREKIRIKNKIKSVTCKKCGKISRWKIK